MRKTIRNILYATVALTSFASADTSETSKTDDRDEICEREAAFGRFSMMKRQDGTPITKLLNLLKAWKAEDHASFSDEYANYFRTLIFAAYEEPRFSTPKNQENAVEEFTNNVFLACIDSVSE